MIRSLIKEYGLYWIVNRSLYSAKLKMMRAIPFTEILFEKDVDIRRVDIFDLNVERIERFLNNLSAGKKTEIITIAENAIEGKIIGFSSIELDYGNPINWHYNPIAKVEVKKSLKWYQIPDFDPERGDIKVIWEASRFSHFYYFARAYLITKEKKYYNAFSSQLNEWLKDNSYSYGANFKCGQEATLRMINALMIYSLFQSYGLIIARDENNIRKLVEVCYKKVLSNFFYAYKCIKNNHTLSEITGLIIGAWSCKDEDRLKKAYKLLDKEIQNQFLPDGGFIQYSFNYQRLVLQLMECVLKISSKTNISISEKSRTLIRNSATLIYQMQDESGDVPNYGSNDGALIFPVTSCCYRDFRPVLNAIYTLIDRRRLYKAGNYDEETLWFANNRLDDIPVNKLTRESLSFKESGFFSLRHDGGFLMVVLQDFKTRPAQMDQLHIDLWHNGKNIFCDSGTYSYSTDTGRKMALSSAHNTVVFQGKEQMRKRGPFLIYDWTKAKNIKYGAESFSGTMVSKNGYEHTRSIKKTQYGYFIQDKVSGNKDHCKINFHTPCEARVNSEGFELFDKDKLLCAVITSGSIEVNKTYRSLYYLKKEEITCVSVRCDLNNNQGSIDFHVKFINY